jgi:hypothetical protein
MLKRIILIVAVFAVVLAGGPARAFVVCDSNGIEYNIRLSNREFIFGTASNLPCGGSAPLVGSFTRVPEGYFFSIFIDQNPLQPTCCEGFEILGIWTGSAGGGNWYDSREDSECAEAGTFTIARCNALPLRSEPDPYPPPGLRY